LTLALSTLLRLLAPYLPFVTEEVWSWWLEGSVHQAEWPRAAELLAIAESGNELAFEVAGEALREVRKAKTEAKVSLRTEVAEAVARDLPERLAALREVEGDLRSAGKIESLRLEEGEAFSVDVTLAEPKPSPTS
jgi:valyl-tRNA synthetase